ncbi:hypothetical protein [Chromobacterium sp. Rain0013]|uniref:hypothetical protein n=1 Tax=Chromobacterium sp. Rain0013 TaxID=2292447 RepID=UPI0018870375|nr:hypothetical protein [Chromobacterium sp. Rain0013]
MHKKSNDLILMVLKKQLEVIADEGGYISAKLLYLSDAILRSGHQKFKPVALTSEGTKVIYKVATGTTFQNDSVVFLTKQEISLLLTHLTSLNS